MGFARRGRVGRGYVVIALLMAASVVLTSCAADPQIRYLSSTSYLPFDMTVATGDRKVFAHYMPSFPISIDNARADEDYYTTELMATDGEDGKHLAYGGYLRDRPLPRSPIAARDWRAVDLRTEMAQARSVGIDGFAVDLIRTRESSDVVSRMFDVAETVDGFEILLTADMSGPLSDLSVPRFAEELAPYLKSDAAFRIADGRPVLGAYKPEVRDVEWWAEVFEELTEAHELDVAFVPTFLDVSTMDDYAPVSYGFGNWGGRTPSSTNLFRSEPGSAVELINRAHSMGKIWMQPVAYQDNRPFDGRYWESENGVTSRNAWQLAIDHNAEWVQLITWNDYAETTAIAPSVKHGWGLLDMFAYHISQFKSGHVPTVVRDTLFVSSRTQSYAADPVYPATELMELEGRTPARDAVEVVSFARDTAVVTASIGDEIETCEVPRGLGVCTFALREGEIVVSMSRDGEVVVPDVRAPDVTNTPFVQDLQYTITGGLR